MGLIRKRNEAKPPPSLPPNRHPIPYHADLETPLLNFGKGDVWRIRDAAEAVAVFGAPGSGKSSGSGQALAHAYLKAGMGGLVLCAKVEEAALWQGYAAACGREADLIMVDETAKEQFNILQYAAATIGKPGFEGNIVSLLEQLNTILKGKDGTAAKADADGYFYTETAARWLISIIWLLRYATDKLSLGDVYRFISTAPETVDKLNEVPQKIKDAEKFESPYQPPFAYSARIAAGMRLHKAAEAQGNEFREMDSFLDYNHYGDVWVKEYPQLSAREQAITAAVIRNSTAHFAAGITNRLFCQGTTFVPEMAREGKIIVLNIPEKQYGAIAIGVQVMIKYLFGRAMQAQHIRKDTRPVFIWADEAQFFMNQSDDDLLSTARSSKTCIVYLTQDLPTYYARMGKDANARAEAILSKFGTRIFHANTSRETNNAASEIIGKEYQQFISVTQNSDETWGDNTGGSWGNRNSGEHHGGTSGTNSGGKRGESVALNERLDFAYPPDRFAWALRTGGGRNGYKVDAILIRNGAQWRSTGRHWMQAEFSQK